MTSTPTLRVGFIGAGNIARTVHLPALQRMDQVELVVVANRSQQSSEVVAHQFNFAQTADHWHQVVERSDLDAIFIGTWPYTHMEMAIAVLESGKHCFCQARMAMDLDQARKMLAVAQQHPHLVNMICPPPMRMPFEPYVKKLIREGTLGPITSVSLHSISGANLNRDAVTWRERADLSGRQVLALGIFAETLNAWVGEYRQLSAQTTTPIATKYDQGRAVSIDVPQVVTIAGQLENGALAVEHHTGLAADKTTPSHRLVIHGLEGTLRYDFCDTIEFAPVGQELKEVQVPPGLRRPWRVERDFIEAIELARAGRPWSVSPDFAEGLCYMKKVEAVHLAAESGRAVNLAEL